MDNTTDFEAKDPDKGFTVLELHEILIGLIAEGYHESTVFECCFDKPLKSVSVCEKK